MNYYPFHIGDYAAHTRNLGLMEDLAYRRLLDAYYLHQAPPKGSPQQIAREIGMKDHAEDVEYVLGKFFTEADGEWRNKRADAEIAKYEADVGKRSKAGKASAEKRALNAKPTHDEKISTHVQHMFNTCSTHDEKISTHEQLTKNQNQNQEEDMAICNQTGESEIAPQQAGDAISSKRESQCTPTATAKEGASLVSPECPQKEIVALWNEMLPEAVGIKIWTEKRSSALRTRWREKKNRQSLDWWKRFFVYVGQSDFLMGRSTSFGRKAFSLSIDWLLKSENFVKVLEGNYHGEEGATA